MKKVLISLILAVLPSAASAQAQGALGQLEKMAGGKTAGEINVPAVAGSCGAAPQSVAAPTPAQLQAAFAKASAPCGAGLQGTWINTGIFPIDEAAAEAFAFKGQYYGQGIKNMDGSDQGALTFAWQDNPLRGKALLGVTFSDLGYKGADQGPNVVTSCGKASCFAQYAYDQSGRMTDQVYFSYECRVLAGAGKILICSASLQVKPGYKGSVIAVDNIPYIGKVVKFSLYKLQSPVK